MQDPVYTSCVDALFWKAGNGLQRCAFVAWRAEDSDAGALNPALRNTWLDVGAV
jgi:hypothetical protein